MKTRLSACATVASVVLAADPPKTWIDPDTGPAS